MLTFLVQRRSLLSRLLFRALVISLSVLVLVELTRIASGCPNPLLAAILSPGSAPESEDAPVKEDPVTVAQRQLVRRHSSPTQRLPVSCIRAGSVLDPRPDEAGRSNRHRSALFLTANLPLRC